MWTDFSSVLLQSTRLTDSQTDGHLSRDQTVLLSMQRGKIPQISASAASIPSQRLSAWPVPRISQRRYACGLRTVKYIKNLKPCCLRCARLSDSHIICTSLQSHSCVRLSRWLSSSWFVTLRHFNNNSSLMPEPTHNLPTIRHETPAVQW